MDRAYRLLVKIKNNRLWSAIVRMHPQVITQMDACRALHIKNPSVLGELLNMTRWPYNVKRNTWWKAAEDIAGQLKDTPEFLFDGRLYGKRPIQKEIAIEVGDEKWIEAHLAFLEIQGPPEEELMEKETKLALKKILATLTPREEQVLNFRFGLNDTEDLDLDETAKRFFISRERVRQIEAKALRRLRHPSRLKRLNAALHGNELRHEEYDSTAHRKWFR